MVASFYEDADLNINSEEHRNKSNGLPGTDGADDASLFYTIAVPAHKKIVVSAEITCSQNR